MRGAAAVVARKFLQVLCGKERQERRRSRVCDAHSTLPKCYCLGELLQAPSLQREPYQQTSTDESTKRRYRSTNDAHPPIGPTRPAAHLYRRMMAFPSTVTHPHTLLFMHTVGADSSFTRAHLEKKW